MNRGRIELSIEELAEDLELFVVENGIETLKITEDFQVIGRKSYIVKLLHMEISKPFVSCWDLDDVIINNRYVLMAFLGDRVRSIYKIWVEGIPHAEMLFADGSVLIELA